MRLFTWYDIEVELKKKRNLWPSWWNRVDVYSDEIVVNIDQEISESIECIFKNNNFIIEDTLREQFIPLLSKVDKIIYLDLPKTLLKYRVIKRYLN